jgi:8-amino-7-oxononanoate synthase
MVRAIVAPTVKKGTERVRVCLHAGNTFEEVERLVQCVGEWVEEMEKGEEGWGKSKL